MSKFVKSENENVETQLETFHDLGYGDKYVELKKNSKGEVYPASIDLINTSSRIGSLNKTMRFMKYSLDCTLRGISNHTFHQQIVATPANHAPRAHKY